MPDLEIGPFLGYDMALIKGGTGPAGGGGTTSEYWVLEEDGVSRWQLEDGSGSWKKEESS